MSLLGFLLCPEGGGNLVWSPIFSGAPGRVSGSPGNLEWRARLSRRWVVPSGRGLWWPSRLWLVSILEQVSFPLDELYSVLSWKADLCS